MMEKKKKEHKTEEEQKTMRMEVTKAIIRR